MELRSKIPPLIVFDDVWQRCLTKPFDFVKVLKHNSLEELESLRVLSALRADALENRNLKDADLETVIDKSVDGVADDRLETYLFHLNDLKSKQETYWTKKTENQMNFYWCSPLADRTDFPQLRGLLREISMVMFLYGCALRERVQWDISEMMKEESDHSTRAMELAKSLRMAAGVFKHIHSTLSEEIGDTLTPSSHLPAELVPAMSQVFEKICLAEAQSLVALRAFEKSTSPSVISTLYVGTSDLFEQASRTLRENTGKFNAVTERLRRFLALSSSVHQIRGYQQAAAVQNAQGESGTAVASCQKALELLETCLVVAETDDRWLSVVQQEHDFQVSLESVYDQDRVSVYYQPIADQVPKLSAGKILVQTMDYMPLDKQPFL